MMFCGNADGTAYVIDPGLISSGLQDCAEVALHLIQ
jgi:hypothetical protein